MVGPAKRGYGASTIGILLVIGLLIAAAQLLQAWSAWRRESGNPGLQSANGMLVAVTLANGQIYYGNLAEAGSSFVKIENVYYVQSGLNPTTKQPDNRLVNRRKADWHGPPWMSIPVEKILMLEGVGSGSRLSELIEQEKKLPSSGAK